MGGGGRYMVNKRGREGVRAGAWRVRKKYFRILRVARRGFLCVYDVVDDEEQCYVRINVTALTALSIRLIKSKIFRVVF